MPPATVRTATLGCKVNQYETEFVRQGLLGIGYADAATDEPADLCIVNTCTVTAEGDAKSRGVIRRMARRNPDARIIVMGCYATRAPEEVRELPGVVEVVTDKRELPDLLGRFGVVDVPTGIGRFNGRTRAYVKVQDGCILRCSFCIIPTVRPGLQSRPAEHVVDEVQRLTEQGHREVVLTGIHLGHYGVDQNRGRPKSEWLRLSHLMQKLAELPGEFRIRISSIEATEVTRELIEVMAAYPQRICPHLHISMQSGSDTVLRRMRRRWGSQRFIDRCGLLKQRLSLPAITTDVIVGFPGETEQEFQETMAVCQEVGFSKIHIFPFSSRRGTPAAEMPDQVAPEVKADRVARLGELEATLRQQYFAKLAGRPLQVLIEGRDSAGKNSAEAPWVGTACRYATMELAADQVPAGAELAGQYVTLLAGQPRGERLQGVLQRS